LIECEKARFGISFSFIQNHLAYFDELERSLEFIRKTPELTMDEKKRFFKGANTNMGKLVS